MDRYDEMKKEYDNTYSVTGRLPDDSFISQNAGLVKNDIVNGKSTFDAVKTVFDNNNNYRLVLEVLRNPL
jgi:hypothetical protein